MFKLNQKGVAPVLVLILLVAGVAVGSYLIQQNTYLFPSASETKKCDPKAKDGQIREGAWGEPIKTDPDSKCNERNEKKATFQCTYKDKGKLKTKKKDIRVSCASPLPSVTVNPTTSTPFNGPHNIPGKIEAEDFDDGGEGIAYHDTDGFDDDECVKKYRDSEGVETCYSSGVNKNEKGIEVSKTTIGEWLKYTVNISQTGSYDIETRLAANNNGAFHIEFDGNNETGIINIRGLGRGKFFLVTTKNIRLDAGQHVMRVVFDSGTGKNDKSLGGFDYFDFKLVSGSGN